MKAIKEIFSRLFVLAIKNKINLYAFTYLLGQSEFLKKVENGVYDDYFNKSLEEIFFDITNKHIDSDDSYGIYDDAYWCGSSYFELFQKTRKSFSYIFLKLPLERMMCIYPVYHEMDITSLIGFFTQAEKNKTILRLLCESNGYSLTKLSQATGINSATLAKYNASDEALYKGSFQNVIKIANFFKAPINLFVETI